MKSRIIFLCVIFLSISSLHSSEKVTRCEDYEHADSLMGPILYDVAWVGGRFIVVGGSKRIIQSEDGFIWKTMDEFIPTGYLHNISYSDRYIYIAGREGIVFYDNENKLWSRAVMPDGQEVDAIEIGIDGVISYDYNRAYFTKDGYSWKALWGKEIGYQGNILGVVWHKNEFVVLGSGNIGEQFNQKVTSIRYIEWPKELGYAKYFMSDGHVLFVAGRKGLIMFSEDGESWQNVKLEKKWKQVDFTSLKYTGGSYFITGRCGTILYSKDGKEWKGMQLGSKQSLLGVAKGGDNQVVVGYPPSLFMQKQVGTIYHRYKNGDWEEVVIPCKGEFKDVCN